MSKRCPLNGVIWVLAVATLGPCGAAEVGRAPPSALPETVTIAQVLDVLREKSPRYAALHYQIEAARADVVGAGVLPNPKLTYGRNDQLTPGNNHMYDGRSQQNYTVEVPILIAGQRGARVETAERNVARSEAEVQAEFAALVREVWSQYVKLLAGQAKIDVLQDAASDLERLHRIVQGREQGGSASPYDVLRMGVESKSLASRLASAQNDLLAASGELGAGLGIREWRPKAAGTLAPLGIASDLPNLDGEALQRNPEIEAARRGEAAADAGLEQARRERWPTPSLLLGTAFTDKPYGNASYAGISVDLPIFDRGQGGMAKAEAAKQAAILARELISARTRVELQTAREVLISRRATLERFDRDVMQPLPQLKDMAENSYRLGQGTLLELLDASRSRTDIRLNHIELLQAEVEAELDVLKASGVLLSTADASK